MRFFPPFLVLATFYLSIVGTEILDDTQTHHTQYDSSGLGIGPTQRPLPDDTKHSPERERERERERFIHPAEFEPTILASKRTQTHALHRAATGIGTNIYKNIPIYICINRTNGWLLIQGTMVILKHTVNRILGVFTVLR